jgi:hypothetical protein
MFISLSFKHTQSNTCFELKPKNFDVFPVRDKFPLNTRFLSNELVYYTLKFRLFLPLKHCGNDMYDLLEN